MVLLRADITDIRYSIFPILRLYYLLIIIDGNPVLSPIGMILSMGTTCDHISPMHWLHWAIHVDPMTSDSCCVTVGKL